MLALKRPEPRAGVLEIEPYVPGNNATPQGATVFKLSSNETPLGPSGVSLEESLKTVAPRGVALLPGTYGSISSTPARGSGRLRANIAFTV